jgi:hypothetical protein
MYVHYLGMIFNLRMTCIEAGRHNFVGTRVTQNTKSIFTRGNHHILVDAIGKGITEDEANTGARTACVCNMLLIAI